MRKVLVWVLALCAVPTMALAKPLSRMDAVALYAADASAAMADTISVPASQSTDDTLAREVTDAVSGIVASGAAQVDVSAANGLITLSGEAASQQVANQLLDLASDVYGVKKVKSDLKLSAS